MGRIAVGTYKQGDWIKVLEIVIHLYTFMAHFESLALPSSYCYTCTAHVFDLGSISVHMGCLKVGF